MNRIISAICLVLLSVAFLCSCSTICGPNKIAIDYTAVIKDMPGGENAFWPDNKLKKAFIEYWSLRYSQGWQKAFEKEAPYFQEIVGRERYENIIGGVASSKIEKMELKSIQKVSEYYYEVRFTLVIEYIKGDKHTLNETDRWVYANQTWYHVIKDNFIFPMAS